MNAKIVTFNGVEQFDYTPPGSSTELDDIRKALVRDRERRSERERQAAGSAYTSEPPKANDVPL